MSDDTSSWRELANAVIQIFGKDTSIDMDELNYLINLALKDNQIDLKEKNVLRGIFSQIPEDSVDPEVLVKIKEFRDKYSI